MIDKSFWDETAKSWSKVEEPAADDVSQQTDSGLYNDFVSFSDISDDDIKSINLRENDTEPAYVKQKGSRLDKELFFKVLDKKQLSDYAAACRLLIKCGLPEDMAGLHDELIERMTVLQEALDKYEDVYHPDMYQFYEYYIPEALQLTFSYTEYLNIEIDDKIIRETKTEVIDAVNRLITAINDTIDDIYKFASIELKAKAKALESMMSQYGYVDPELKM